MTTSITYYPTEEPTIPSAEIVNFLQEEWNSRFITIPHIVSMNDGITHFRQNLNSYDVINVITGNPSQELKPIGNWTYGNFSWKIILDIYTNISRERLWQLQHEVMNISFRNLHKIPNYQRITYQKFSEMVDKQANMWQGQIQLELESKAVRLRDPLA